MRWPRVEIATPAGPREGIAPAVVTASRATDIPAFHSAWLLNRLAAGWCRWDNPFGGPSQYVSFERLRAMVLFTKDPGAVLGFADVLEQRGLAFYVHATLNDYESEGWEPGVPPLADRLRGFAELSRRLGRERVIWRFDPLLCGEATPLATLLARIEALGERLHPFTDRLVFSFVHLERYAKVRRNLASAGVPVRSFTAAEMIEAAGRMAALGRKWGLAVASCGEEADLSASGVVRNRCVDPELLLRLAPGDAELARLYGPRERTQVTLPITPATPASPNGQGRVRTDPASATSRFRKDSGQRKACGCGPAKDIGAYTTCGHGCVYCYANASPAAGRRGVARADSLGEALGRE